MLCVIRVGSSTVSFHASDIVLSCVIVCYCVLSRLAAVRLLHTMPVFLLCYQCYYITVHEHNIDNTVKESWNVTVCFVCYQSWQQHSYIPCMLPLLCYQRYPVLSCVIVCYCVLLCVIRVGSSKTVTYHAWFFTVLSMLL